MMQCRLVFSAVSTNCQHSSTLIAAGTSMATCLLHSIAKVAIGVCINQSVQMNIKSASSDSHIFFHPSTPVYPVASERPASFNSC